MITPNFQYFYTDISDPCEAIGQTAEVKIRLTLNLAEAWVDFAFNTSLS